MKAFPSPLQRFFKLAGADGDALFPRPATHIYSYIIIIIIIITQLYIYSKININGMNFTPDSIDSRFSSFRSEHLNEDLLFRNSQVKWLTVHPQRALPSLHKKLNIKVGIKMDVRNRIKEHHVGVGGGCAEAAQDNPSKS